MKQTKLATITVDRNPAAGDVLKIAGKNEVVVAAGRHIDRDQLRGDSYHVDYFDTIFESELSKDNPRVKHYILPGGSMGKDKAKLIEHKDIELIRTGKLKTETVVRYMLP